MALAVHSSQQVVSHPFIAPPRVIPDRFMGPFDSHQTLSTPDIIRQAVDEWLTRAVREDWYNTLMNASEGKMFGVLVVRTESGFRYLVAYSGKLCDSWHLDGFVPPIFESAVAEKRLADAAEKIAALTRQMESLVDSHEMQQLNVALKKNREKAASELAEFAAWRKRRKSERDAKRRCSVDGTDLTALDLQSQQDRANHRRLKDYWSKSLATIVAEKETLSDQVQALEHARKALSQQAQIRHFESYLLLNSRQQEMPMTVLFSPDGPPGGAGDCAAPKLLQCAYRQRWEPLALAEFWLGKSSTMGVRHHGKFYAPCRSRCAPILSFMMPEESGRGDTPVSSSPAELTPEIAWEDDDILILNKPSGMLSTPGKIIQWSVQEWVRQHYPDACGALLVHRLDMDTSGLLMVAKNAHVHKALQQQFLNRSIKKRYTAVLDGDLKANQGTVNLPLRVDLDDRPRQLVCRQYGKPAQTFYQVVQREPNRVRVQFTPVTGRTHQLRVHAAHKEGLSAPIAGDALYGFAGRRLHLHADKLEFTHPVQQQRISVSSPVPF